MIHRVLLVLGICAYVPVAACGSRSSLGWEPEGGARGDSSAPRFEAGRRDALPVTDGPFWCVDGDAKWFAGTYAGKWDGSWSCGRGSTSLGGSVTLTQTVGPGFLVVNGQMETHGLPAVRGAITGQTVCDAGGAMSFSGVITNLVIGSGVVQTLQGNLEATSVPSMGAPPQFVSGTWSAQDTGSSCKAAGTWSARL